MTPREFLPIYLASLYDMPTAELQAYDLTTPETILGHFLDQYENATE